MFGSRLPAAAGSALGFGAAVAATLLAWTLAWTVGAEARPVLALVLLAAVAVGVGSMTTLAGALACAAQCWGLYSGFVLHRYGELWLDPPSRLALVLLVALGVGASLLALGLDAVLTRRRMRAVTSAVRSEMAPVPRRPVPVGPTTGGHRMR